MTRTNNTASATPRPTVPWRDALMGWLMLIAFLMTGFAAGGCRTRLLVLPADKTVTFLPAGQTWRATHDTYLVPPARMQEILRALNSTNLNH